MRCDEDLKFTGTGYWQLAADYFSGALLHLVEHGEEHDGEKSVGDRGAQGVRQVEWRLHSSHSTGHDVIDDFLHQIKTCGHKETRAWILYVDLDAQRRGGKSDDRLRDPKQSQEGMGKAVLHQSDDHAGEQAGDGVSPRHRKKYRDQQRKVEDVEER